MQGFNMGRYIPPASQDASLSSDKVGGFNSQKGHPLGSRFSKAKDGIIKIRFEMPFDVWCEACQPEFLIKQGIRFNAEKKKIGKYLTTPIWDFTFRHPPCGGTIGIRTDPENTAYAVTAGGRKKAGAFTTALDKDYGEIMTEEERERRRNDAFARIEGLVEQKQQSKNDSTRISELYEAQDRDWVDPYSANQKLRKTFRVGRKLRETSEKDKEAIADQFSLGLDLLDVTQEDKDRAAMVEYGDPSLEKKAVERALARPLFDSPHRKTQPKKPAGMPKSEWEKQQSLKAFQNDVTANTKAKMNAFNIEPDWMVPKRSPRTPQIIQRVTPDLALKRTTSDPEDGPKKVAKLVIYDDTDESDG